MASILSRPQCVKTNQYIALRVTLQMMNCSKVKYSCIWISRQHDDVIIWKHFLRYLPCVRGIHWSQLNSTHKGQWHRALMFSLACAWINVWVNNREAGDLRRHRAHYDVTAMSPLHWRDWPPQAATKKEVLEDWHRTDVSVIDCRLVTAIMLMHTFITLVAVYNQGQTERTYFNTLSQRTWIKIDAFRW